MARSTGADWMMISATGALAPDVFSTVTSPRAAIPAVTSLGNDNVAVSFPGGRTNLPAANETDTSFVVFPLFR